MDYDQLKAGVKEIAEIAASVPERFRDKCFELLLSGLLRQEAGASADEEKAAKAGRLDTSQGGAGTRGRGAQGGIPITTQLRVLMKRTGITKEELDKILLYENGEVHFVKEPHPKGVTTGQIEWALLLALKITREPPFPQWRRHS